ncbi:hypothetical protein AAFF_G00390980 [Aldrovandia affinis]|uniref:Uncharacterized protein n=1 Tax=Aldrovandia affinis TaxID=143900 RepID=A0AAD7R3X2_9TELE|nr:hypothetical protein AAFF_G00390980 [Aldrovandia affinis]
MMNTQKAEYALAAGRKEIANLRQKLIEVNTHLEEIKRPVFVPSLIKGDSASGKSEVKLNMEKLQAEKMCEQLEERIKKMECDRACMRSEKKQQESLNMILQEKLDILYNLCQQKDKALRR